MQAVGRELLRRDVASHVPLPYGVGENTYVVPDVTVERDDKEEWVISIPDQHLPKVRINDAYYQLYEAQTAFAMMACAVFAFSVRFAMIISTVTES